MATAGEQRQSDECSLVSGQGIPLTPNAPCAELTEAYTIEDEFTITSDINTWVDMAQLDNQHESGISCGPEYVPSTMLSMATVGHSNE